MLRAVNIRQFRSCRDVQISGIGPLVALVGRNGVGKTNILAAIRSLAVWITDAKRTRDTWEINEDDIEAVLELAEKTFRYRWTRVPAPGTSKNLESSQTTHMKEELHVSRRGQPETLLFSRLDELLTISGTDNRLVKIGPKAPAIAAIESIFPDDDELLNAVTPIANFFRSVRYYPFDEPIEAKTESSEIFSDEEYVAWKELSKQKKYLDDSLVMRIIDLSVTGDARLEELKALLGPKGLGLILEIFYRKFELDVGQEKKTYHVLRFSTTASKAHSPTFPFTFNQLSTGTRLAIRLIVSLVLDDSSLMLIEHPEDGIHRGLLRKLTKILKEYSSEHQIFLSTHSSAVVNAFEPENLRLITFQSGITHARGLTEDERESCCAYLEDEGSVFEYIETLEDE